MSTPILPFAVWAAGTNQNSIPANDNSLRNQILNGLVISQSTTAQPGSPTTGDIYIIASTHTGAQWSTFTPKDLAIYSGGSWYAFAPVAGVVVNVAGALYKYDAGAWAAVTAGGLTNPMTTVGDLIVGGTSGAAGRLAAGTSTYVLTSNGAGVAPTWQVAGSGSPAGSTTQIQYNNAGAFGAEAAFAYDQSTNTLSVDKITLNGLLLTLATASGGAGFRLPHGTAPTSPTNGDVWTTTAGVYAYVNGATVGPLGAGGGGSLTNWTESVNTSAPNATVPAVRFIVTNAATNVDAVVSPKGAGALLAHLPNNASSGGNKRGSYAVDFQMQRGSNAQVASGIGAFLGGGQNNTADGDQSAVAGGLACQAGAPQAFASGLSCQALGPQSQAIGESSSTALDCAFAHGYFCAADGYYSEAGGNNATVRGMYGGKAHAGGAFAAAGDAQRRESLLRVSTTNATGTVLTANGGSASATNQIVLPSGSTYKFTAQVAARQNTTGDSASWAIVGLIKNIAGTTTLVGTPSVTQDFADSGASTWTVAMTANNTLDCPTFTVTGEASKSIKWLADVRTVEIVG